MGGELPSFHTFIRLSHNLAAEKLNHDKNWGKRWGCEVALQVLQQIGKNQPWWHLWSTGEAGTENLCWIKVNLIKDLPKGRRRRALPTSPGDREGLAWDHTKQCSGLVPAAAAG